MTSEEHDPIVVLSVAVGAVLVIWLALHLVARWHTIHTNSSVRSQSCRQFCSTLPNDSSGQTPDSSVLTRRRATPAASSRLKVQNSGG